MNSRHIAPSSMPIAQLSIVVVVGVAMGIAVSRSFGLGMTVVIASIILGAAIIQALYDVPIALVAFGSYIIPLYGGSREFAYLGVNVGPSTIYISEIALLIVGFLLLPAIVESGVKGLRDVVPLPLAFYFLLGAIALARGIPEHGVAALRDSVIVYYAIAYSLTILLTNNWKRLKALIVVFWVGWVAAAVMVIYRYLEGVGFYLPLHDVTRYGAGSQAVSVASSVGTAVTSLCAGVGTRIRIVLISLGVVHLVIGLFLIQARSLLISILITSLLVTYACVPERVPAILMALFFTMALALMPYLLSFRSVALPPIVEKTYARAESILNPGADPNAEWRMYAWRHAISYGVRHPILGAGFGAPMNIDLPDRSDLDVDPHNSYAAILYRLGVSGLIVFFVFWCGIIRRAISRCRTDPNAKFWLGIALSAHVGGACFAFFNVALEGPYMGIPFWTTLALVHQASVASYSEDGGGAPSS